MRNLLGEKGPILRCLFDKNFEDITTDNPEELLQFSEILRHVERTLLQLSAEGLQQHH